jgi:hypothetical protein
MSRHGFSIIGIVVLVGVIGSFSCSTKDGGKPSDAEKVSVFQQPCSAFCQHLRTLECQEGAPLKDGTPCETFCIDTQEAGHDLNIPCVLQIQSCGELQRCNR